MKSKTNKILFSLFFMLGFSIIKKLAWIKGEDLYGLLSGTSQLTYEITNYILWALYLVGSYFAYTFIFKQKETLKALILVPLVLINLLLGFAGLFLPTGAGQKCTSPYLDSTQNCYEWYGWHEWMAPGQDSPFEELSYGSIYKEKCEKIFSLEQSTCPAFIDTKEFNCFYECEDGIIQVDWIVNGDCSRALVYAKRSSDRNIQYYEKKVRSFLKLK